MEYPLNIRPVNSCACFEHKWYLPVAQCCRYWWGFI